MNLKKSVKRADFEDFMASLLDPQDSEVIVVRGKDCETLYTNARAELRMSFALNAERKCSASYAKSLPGLCTHCPYGNKAGAPDLKPFELEDKEGYMFSGKTGMINWIDGKPAAVLFLRDITLEKKTNEKLFALAYIDQLTGIPNRQSLKEAFKNLDVIVADKNVTGAVALFDLDRFKAVNDTYGHNTGDMILRRLAEHLSGEKAFSDRIYRLGGDEFVLLLPTPPDNITEDEAVRKYYSDILSTTLRSYTLPNIELECTLSMGVSFFPKHGNTLSELLRKSDIAMYKAKDAGRNRVIFFEDRYDIAQKFKDLYINIQPILLATGKTFGYELIDSGSGKDEDDETVNLREFNRALDALGLKDIENDTRYFITYSRLLLSPSVLSGLPKDKFVVQLNFTDRLTNKDLNAYTVLRKAGYSLALMNVMSSKASQELLSLVSYLKFSPDDVNTMMQKRIIAASPNIRFIATGVDTPELFEAAKATGYQMFQGFFFNQPVIVKKTKEIGPMKLNYFRLLQLASTDGYMDFREISAVISSDLALTYKLLRLLNSAAVGLRNVSSISMAIAYLGEENLKKWIAVLALRGIAEDKPLELVRLSLIRARFGELLAPQFRIRRDPNQAFMVGMLSLLHIALEKSKEKLLEEIPVAEDISLSLLTKNGVYSDLLLFFENYEYSNWDDVSQFNDKYQLDNQAVNDAYIEAVRWYNDLLKQA